jgi:hypothetical protein
VLIPLAAICFSRREDVFTFSLVYKEIWWILYFQCYFRRQCCNKLYYSLMHKGLFLSTLTGHTALVFSHNSGNWDSNHMLVLVQTRSKNCMNSKYRSSRIQVAIICW